MNRREVRISEVCQIQPPKSEVRLRLKGSDAVTFAPMETLGIDRKNLVGTTERPLADVAGSYTYFAENDVLLAKITPCFENGKLGIASDLTNGAGFGSSEYIVFRPSENLIPKYLYYFLSQESFRTVGAKHMTGTAGQKRITRTYIESCLIPVPSLRDQERIVGILDEAFEGIATARANIETTCTKANELVDIKLQTLLTASADGWKSLTLAEVASDYGRGKSKHRPRNDPKLYGGIYPFVQTGDVRNANQYVTTYSQTYNDVGLSQSKLWPKGTLCVTIAANIAETAILDFDACFPDSVIGVVANPSKANTRFIEYQLRVAKAQLQAKGKGSAQDNINLATFETHPFSFPSLSVQEVLVERLDSIALLSESLTGVHQQKLHLLDELKQAILSQAFSGNL